MGSVFGHVLGVVLEKQVTKLPDQVIAGTIGFAILMITGLMILFSSSHEDIKKYRQGASPEDTKRFNEQSLKDWNARIKAESEAGLTDKEVGSGPDS